MLSQFSMEQQRQGTIRQGVQLQHDAIKKVNAMKMGKKKTNQNTKEDTYC